MTDDCLFDFLCPKKKPEIVEYAPAQVYKARKKCISVITSEGRQSMEPAFDAKNGTLWLSQQTYRTKSHAQKTPAVRFTFQTPCKTQRQISKSVIIPNNMETQNQTHRRFSNLQKPISIPQQRPTVKAINIKKQFNPIELTSDIRFQSHESNLVPLSKGISQNSNHGLLALKKNASFELKTVKSIPESEHGELEQIKRQAPRQVGKITIPYITEKQGGSGQHIEEIEPVCLTSSKSKFSEINSINISQRDYDQIFDTVFEQPQQYVREIGQRKIMLSRIIGIGKYSQVWLCQQLSTRTLYSYKQIFTGNPLTQHLLQQPGQIICKNPIHPNIMQLFGLSVLRGKVCFLQEYCEMSLYEMITQDVLQEQLAWRFLKQIIEAVAHLHSLKCHHGNINCEQVLVVHNSCKVKIPLMEVPQKDDELQRSYLNDKHSVGLLAYQMTYGPLFKANPDNLYDREKMYRNKDHRLNLISRILTTLKNKNDAYDQFIVELLSDLEDKPLDSTKGQFLFKEEATLDLCM